MCVVFGEQVSKKRKEVKDEECERSLLVSIPERSGPFLDVVRVSLSDARRFFRARAFPRFYRPSGKSSMFGSFLTGDTCVRVCVCTFARTTHSVAIKLSNMTLCMLRRGLNKRSGGLWFRRSPLTGASVPLHPDE